MRGAQEPVAPEDRKGRDDGPPGSRRSAEDVRFPPPPETPLTRGPVVKVASHRPGEGLCTHAFGTPGGEVLLRKCGGATMGWQPGEVFKCPNAECECELTLTRPSRRERGA